jgi:hypothetical protein
MADSKISALTADTTLDDTDEAVLNSGATSKKITGANLKASMPGYEFGYAQVTGNTTISATTEGAANDIVTLGAITYPALPIVVEFFFPRVTNGTGGSTFFVLLNDATVLGLVGLNSASGVAGVGIPVFGKRRFTPTAGSHTIKVAAYRNTANSTVEAGTGATTTFFPGFIRATLV